MGRDALDNLDGTVTSHLRKELEAGTESLGADIIHVILDSAVPFTALEVDGDTVGDIKTFLTDVLDAVDQLTGNALVTQFGGDGDIESDSETTFVGNHPTGDVLSGYFDIGDEYLHRLAFDGEFATALSLKSIDLLLRELHNLSADSFHDFAIAGTQCLEVWLDSLAGYGEHNLRKWLTYADVALFAQRETHGANLLSQLHALLKPLIHHIGVVLGEGHMVHGSGIQTVGDAIEVEEESFAEEGSDGRHETCERFEASVESLIGGDLVGGHITLPETATAKTDIPVAEIGIDKLLNSTACLGGFIVSESLVNSLDQSVQLTQNPTVDFGTFSYGDIGFLILKAIDIGIESEKAISVVKSAE